MSIKAARFEIVIGETLGVLQSLGKTVYDCIGMRLAVNGSPPDFDSLEKLHYSTFKCHETINMPIFENEALPTFHLDFVVCTESHSHFTTFQLFPIDND